MLLREHLAHYHGQLGDSLARVDRRIHHQQSKIDTLEAYGFRIASARARLLLAQYETLRSSLAFNRDLIGNMLIGESPAPAKAAAEAPDEIAARRAAAASAADSGEHRGN